jgi:RimJ/RimL family protein N-acetyltransferase
MYQVREAGKSLQIIDYLQLKHMTLFETQRLIIRKIEDSDKASMLDFHNDPATMAFISSGKADWSPEELNRKLQMNELLYPAGFGIYAVEQKETSSVIGEASIFNSFDDLEQPEIGYIIARNYWNQGYGTEIVNGLIDYCKHTLCAQRIVAQMYAGNIYSARLCEKAGMQLYETLDLENGKQRLSFHLIC